MGKFIDLTGQKINRWTVIKRAENRGKAVYWTCQCECGTIKDVQSKHLRSGASKSCGCLQKEKSAIIMKEIGKQPKNNFIDLTGQQFGDWTVISRAENNNNGSAMWNCKCKCGNTSIVRGTALRAGETMSCKKCHTYKNNLAIDDLKDKQFGKLTAKKLLQEVSNNGSRLWECQCSCGNIIKASRKSLLNGDKKSCGCLTSYGEFLIEKILKTNNISYIKQKTFTNCIFPKSQKQAKFDFFVNDTYLIEFDGIQHFQTKNQGWDTEEKFKKTQEYDQFKNQWCKENDIPLIRIPYTKYDDLCLEDLLLETSSFII